MKYLVEVKNDKGVTLSYGCETELEVGVLSDVMEGKGHTVSVYKEELVNSDGKVIG